MLIVSKEVLPYDILSQYNLWEDIFVLIYSLFIFYKSIVLLFGSGKNYSSILVYDDLGWLKKFISLGGVVLLLWCLSVLLNNLSETIQPPYNYYPLRLGSSILIYWIGYQAFFRYVMLSDRILLRRELKEGITVIKNPATQITTSDSKGEQTFKQVDTHIMTNKKYLDPHYSLEKLCEQVGMGSSNLSKLINTHAGSNFSDYINALRANEAQKLLSDSNFSAYTIVAIGLECGFNSKSTFYTAFKKFAGHTPTEFRKSFSS